MTTLLGPILVLAGFGLYMVTSTRFRGFAARPGSFLAVSAAGVVVAAADLLTDGGWANGFAAALSLALFGFQLWFFFSFSMYGTREDRPRIGDRFPAFRLPASDGTVFDSESARGARQLLIFYRGSW